MDGVKEGAGRVKLKASVQNRSCGNWKGVIAPNSARTRTGAAVSDLVLLSLARSSRGLYLTTGCSGQPVRRCGVHRQSQ